MGGVLWSSSGQLLCWVLLGGVLWSGVWMNEICLCCACDGIVGWIRQNWWSAFAFSLELSG